MSSYTAGCKRLERPCSSFVAVISPSRRGEFILDVLGCFEQLGRRMGVENKTLYPLADAAE